MEKRFCPACGTELAANDPFCANCGCALPRLKKTAGRPKRERFRFWLTVAALAAAAAVAVMLILILALSGSPAGDVLKNYREKEILGAYGGTAAVEKLSIGGNYDEIAELVGLVDQNGLEKYEDTVREAALQLGKDSLTILLDAPLFMSSQTILIEDLTFTKGRAKATLDEALGDAMQGSSLRVKYDLTLHEATSKRMDYRIYGTVEVRYELVVLGEKATYKTEFTLDCEGLFE